MQCRKKAIYTKILSCIPVALKGRHKIVHAPQKTPLEVLNGSDAELVDFLNSRMQQASPERFQAAPEARRNFYFTLLTEELKKKSSKISSDHPKSDSLKLGMFDRMLEEADNIALSPDELFNAERVYPVVIDYRQMSLLVRHYARLNEEDQHHFAMQFARAMAANPVYGKLLETSLFENEFSQSDLYKIGRAALYHGRGEHEQMLKWLRASFPDEMASKTAWNVYVICYQNLEDKTYLHNLYLKLKESGMLDPLMTRSLGLICGFNENELPNFFPEVVESWPAEFKQKILDSPHWLSIFN